MDLNIARSHSQVPRPASATNLPDEAHAGTREETTSMWIPFFTGSFLGRPFVGGETTGVILIRIHHLASNVCPS